jgi:hypothetical protein
MTRAAYDFEAETRLEWQRRAACRGMDPEMFTLLPGFMKTADYQEAHRTCETCPVKTACEEYAVETGSWGLIFGGRDFHKPERLPVTFEGRCERCGTRFTALVVTKRFCTETCKKLHHRSTRG